MIKRINITLPFLYFRFCVNVSEKHTNEVSNSAGSKVQNANENPCNKVLKNVDLKTEKIFSEDFNLQILRSTWSSKSERSSSSLNDCPVFFLN